MPISTFDQELELNRAAYEREREEIRQAGQGHYVAIAAGRLVALTTNFDDAVRAIEELSPPPEHFLVFPADEEPIYDVIDDFHVECE